MNHLHYHVEKEIRQEVQSQCEEQVSCKIEVHSVYEYDPNNIGYEVQSGEPHPAATKVLACIAAADEPQRLTYLTCITM